MVAVLDTLIVLGATGDLTGRLLLPAVAALRAAGSLGTDFRFIGAGPQPWTSEQFVAHARGRLVEHAAHLTQASQELLLASVSYCQADVTDPLAVGAVIDLAAPNGRNGSRAVALYLALPTQLMLGAVRAIHTHGLPAGSRVAVEKPFGHDAQSATELNLALSGIGRSSDDETVYRVDHARAMTSVQALSRARHPHTDERIEWSNHEIERVELLWEETLALEDRASFYDRAGALRDVMQNHLLQVLCTIAQPESADGVAPAERRAAVLRNIRPFDDDDVRTRTRRARYTAGRLADSGGARLVPDYAAERGVNPSRDTETFAEVVLNIDAPQWIGTDFVLRAGKALDTRRRGVLITFRPDVSGTTATRGPAWLDLDAPARPEPSDSEPSDSEPPDSVPIVVAPPGAEPAAYQTIVADLLAGTHTFAVSAEETELQWQVLTPVLRGWAANLVPMKSYPAGSAGPS
jgi:glucose-6-phosphate 1-dehydrogenase